MTFNAAFKYKLIYVFAIPDKDHEGLLKIGETTISTDKSLEKLDPNSKELNQAANERIKQYTETAAINYNLLHTELAVRSEKMKCIAFSDKDVHAVLKRSGFKPHDFGEKKGREWFQVDLDTAKNAIKAVKEGRESLQGCEISEGRTPIIFRPEQLKAIKDTIFRFKSSDHMLWNAKMRFGKTLTALQVAKECGFKKTIIITHRPVVNENWFDDFHKIFYDTDYKFGSKTKGERIETLIEKEDTKFVYFASIQDLRGSEAAGGKFDKNLYEFLTEWDFVIIDEAHEGTQTKRGQSVINLLNDQKKKPKLLELSGTPFNILSKYTESEVYTWDYVMEQKAKATWEETHFGDSNPYAGLPKLQIYTYNLNKFLPIYIDAEDSAFNFHEFFKVWTGKTEKDFKPMPDNAKVGDFIHEKDVKRFLDLLCKSNEDSNYPYSTEEFRNYFRHSLWIVPGVKEAKALSALLKNHQIFHSFNIANVAGDGDEEEKYSDALEKVKNINFIDRLEGKINDKRLEFLLGEASRDISFEETLKNLLGYNDDKKSNVTIIDLSGVPFEVLSITVSLISRILFDYGYVYKRYRYIQNENETVNNDIPLLLVYEEAHKYVPNSDMSKYRSSRQAIERIAKEGRKYGITLLLASQRPSEISETIFSQCNNFIAMRLTNPNDQNYVKKLLPDTLGSLANKMPSLKAGQCLLIGDAVVLPSVVQIERCNPEPSSNDIPYFKLWKEEWKNLNIDALNKEWIKK